MINQKGKTLWLINEVRADLRYVREGSKSFLCGVSWFTATSLPVNVLPHHVTANHPASGTVRRGVRVTRQGVKGGWAGLILQGHLVFRGGGGLMFSTVREFSRFFLCVCVCIYGVHPLQCSKSPPVCNTLPVSQYARGQKATLIVFGCSSYYKEKPCFLSRIYYQHPSVAWLGYRWNRLHVGHTKGACL